MWQQLPEKTHDLLITELAAILCCNSKTTGQVYLLYNLSFPLDRVTFVPFSFALSLSYPSSVYRPPSSSLAKRLVETRMALY